MHPMYMAEKLRWRRTGIRTWRDAKKLTLEEVAEILGRPPYKIKTTHNSLGRVERGQQMPKIELIEALTKIYDIDIHSLLNRTAGRPRPNEPLTLDERELLANLIKKVTQD